VSKEPPAQRDAVDHVKSASGGARAGYDPALAGRPAECDGGGSIAGTRLAGRQEFAGVLSGEYVDHGDPPWRWYLLGELSHKPDGYEFDTVWCESGSLFVIGETT
jgi:hypothetical protein